jgi:hypothetical protein
LYSHISDGLLILPMPSCSGLPLVLDSDAEASADEAELPYRPYANSPGLDPELEYVVGESTKLRLPLGVTGGCCCCLFFRLGIAIALDEDAMVRSWWNSWNKIRGTG